MQEVGCVASPGDLLLRPTVCNQTRNPWKGLMEELMEALPGGGAVLKNLPDGGAVLKNLPVGGTDGGPAWWRS